MIKGTLLCISILAALGIGYVVGYRHGSTVPMAWYVKPWPPAVPLQVFYSEDTIRLPSGIMDTCYAWGVPDLSATPAQIRGEGVYKTTILAH